MEKGNSVNTEIVWYECRTLRMEHKYTKGSRGKLNWEKQVGACRAVLIDGLSPWVCGIFTQTLSFPTYYLLRQ